MTEKIRGEEKEKIAIDKTFILWESGKIVKLPHFAPTSCVKPI